jgi:hypothetical protein
MYIKVMGKQSPEENRSDFREVVYSYEVYLRRWTVYTKISVY